MKRGIVALCISLALTGALFLCLDFGQYKVYPFDPSSGTLIGVSHEGIDSNWSRGTADIDQDSLLHFRYVLSNNGPEPFAGMYIHWLDSSRELFRNFSDYDQIIIHLKADKAKRIPVFLTLNYKGFTVGDKPLSSLHLVQVIEYHGEDDYVLHKKDFEVPSWWLRLHGLTKENLIHIDYSRLNYIVINSCQMIGPDTPDEITISAVTFSHDNSVYYIVYGILMFLMLAGVLISGWVKKKKVLVPYQVQELKNDGSDTKIDHIVHYIAKHYSNPELSVEDLQKELGMTTREIGTQIKQHLDSSFKSYLNAIRLAEVKRLLLETELPVSDIAYKTGYNNIPHFNRVFKKEFDTTPKEFRASNK